MNIKQTHKTVRGVVASQAFLDRFRSRSKALGLSRPTTDTNQLPLRKRTCCGVSVVVENPAYSIRAGKNDDGTPWQTRMLCDYGYMPTVKGSDGEGADVYCGPDDNAKNVYGIKQVKPETGKFDEYKWMLGFSSPEDAVRAYLVHYDKPDYFGGIVALPMKSFRNEVRRGAVKSKSQPSFAAGGIEEVPYQPKKGRNPNPRLLRRATQDELDSIGAKHTPHKLDKNADPNCPHCKGSGAIDTPDTARSGHVCPCTFRKRPKTFSAEYPEYDKLPYRKLKQYALSFGKKGTAASQKSAHRDAYAHHSTAAIFHRKAASKSPDPSTKQWHESQAKDHSEWAGNHRIVMNNTFSTDVSVDAMRKAFASDWRESDHPRGQPGNAGQFAPKGHAPTGAWYMPKGYKRPGAHDRNLALAFIKKARKTSPKQALKEVFENIEENKTETDKDFKARRLRMMHYLLDVLGHFHKNPAGKKVPVKKTEKPILPPEKTVKAGSQRIPVKSKPVSGKVTKPKQEWGFDDRVKNMKNPKRGTVYSAKDLDPPPDTYEGEEFLPPISRKNIGEEAPEWFRKLVDSGDASLPAPGTEHIRFVKRWPNKGEIFYRCTNASLTGSKQIQTKRHWWYDVRSDAAKWKLIEQIQPHREKIRHDLDKIAKSGSGAVSDAAFCLRMIYATGLRSGEENETEEKIGAEYTDKKTGEKKNRTAGGHTSYGASGLLRKHVTHRPDGLIKIEFVGKKGKVNTRYISNDPNHDLGPSREIVRKAYEERKRTGKAPKMTKELSGAIHKLSYLPSLHDDEKSLPVCSFNYDPDLHRLLRQRLAKKGEPDDKFFGCAKSDVSGLCDTLSKRYGIKPTGHPKWDKLKPHNFRHMVATQRASDVMMAKFAESDFKVPEKRSQYNKLITEVGQVAGDAINDTPGAIMNSYVTPSTFSHIARISGAGNWAKVLTSVPSKISDIHDDLDPELVRQLKSKGHFAASPSTSSPESHGPDDDGSDNWTDAAMYLSAIMDGIID